MKNTMRCKIPITPAFGSVMNATSEDTINDPTFEKQFTLKVYITTCYRYIKYMLGENQVKRKWGYLQPKAVNSFHSHNARKH